MIKKYPDLTGTLYQKYVYDIYNEDAFPINITSENKLYFVRIPVAKKLYGQKSKSLYKDWYEVAEEIEHLYSEIIADYNSETVNHAGLISLVGVFLEYLIKYEICRRNSCNDDLIKKIFYSDNYSLKNIIAPKNAEDENYFNSLYELLDLREILLSFVKIRNSYIHTNFKIRNDAQILYLQKLGFNEGYFLINKKLTLLINETAGINNKTINVEKNVPDFFGNDEAYLTICLVFEVWQRLYKSKDTVIWYNNFMKMGKKLPSELKCLYYK